MSLAVNELNYMIWRYLQEAGLDVSAYALEDETKVNELDSSYSNLVPIGCLVDLVQKGILYTKMKEISKISESDEITQDELANLNFNFFAAVNELNKGIEERKIVSRSDQESTQLLTSTDKSKLENSTQTSLESGNAASTSEDDFISIIKPVLTYEMSLSVSCSKKTPSLFAYSTPSTSTTNNCVIQSTDPISKTVLSLPLPCKDTNFIRWSPDDSTLLTASENGEIKLWDKNGFLKSTLSMHHYPILNVVFSPNGDYLLSMDLQNTLIVWNLQNNSILLHLNKQNYLKFLNLSTSTPTHDFLGSSLCWIDNSKFIIPGFKNTLLVCQIQMDNNTSPLIGLLSGHEDLISFIKYNPNLKLLATSSDDGQIRIWKGNSINSLQIINAHSLPVTYLSWIKLGAGDYILSASIDGSIKVWDFINNQLVVSNNIDDGQGIICAEYNHEKQLLIVGDTLGYVSIWKINENQVKQTSLYQDENDEKDLKIMEISLSHDNNRAAISYSNSTSIMINL